ncbi:MAG: hypothetical protein LPK43_01315 [Gammaproteobacteria bacterium]|mgnify:FL=1|nr:hypothetical protein [Gammaproteobacteria bacterium]
MNNKLKALAIVMLVASLVVLAGCRTATVYNVNEAPVNMTKSNYTASDVRQAIVQAGARLGWQMKEIQPGLILGTLFIRDHMAQVEIPYDTNNYSIRYKDSSNLNYDGENIHSNYNGWIQNLDNAIRSNLINQS